MTKEEKNTLLIYISSEIQKARENAVKADEASKFIISGLSQSGDKYHAQNTAGLAKYYAEGLEKLNREISNLKEGSRAKVEPVTHVEVLYDDGNKLDFYLVENAVSLTKFSFISKASPLGASILGKRVGDTFVYELGEGDNKKTFTGRILKVD